MTPPAASPWTADETSRALARRLYHLTALDLTLSRAPAQTAPRVERRRAVVGALWDRAPFVAGPPRPVTEVDAADITPARFVEISDDYRRPVVVRGFAARSTAVRTWSFAGLAERAGDRTVAAVELDTRPDAHRTTGRRVLRDMTFADFVDRAWTEPLYVHNSQVLTGALPELLDELDLPRVRDALAGAESGWDPIFDAALFIGTDKVFSSVHCAPGGNFFTQITGRKTWTLVEPELSPYLLPMFARPFATAFSGHGTFHTADPASVLHRLPRYQVTLEPGDLLYNAPWWWHEVVNDGPTIGCAMRHVVPQVSRSPTWDNHPLFTALSAYPKLWAISRLHHLAHRVHRRLGGGGPRDLRSVIARLMRREVQATRGRRGGRRSTTGT